MSSPQENKSPLDTEGAFSQPKRFPRGVDSPSARKDLHWSPSAPANKLPKLEGWQAVLAGWLRLGSEATGSPSAQGDAELHKAIQPLPFWY